MIQATCVKCGKAINSLAAEGKIRPVILTLADNTRLECNSAWAATDYLKDNNIERAYVTIRYFEEA